MAIAKKEMMMRQRIAEADDNLACLYCGNLALCKHPHSHLTVTSLDTFDMRGSHKRDDLSVRLLVYEIQRSKFARIPRTRRCKG